MSTISSELTKVMANTWELYQGNKERFKIYADEALGYRRSVGNDVFDTLVLTQNPVWNQSSEYNLPLDPTPDAVFYPLTLHLHSITEEQKKMLEGKGFLKQNSKNRTYQIEIADFTLPPNAYDELLLKLGISESLINEMKGLCHAAPNPSPKTSFSSNQPLIFSFQPRSSSEICEKTLKEWSETGSVENFKNQPKDVYIFTNPNPNSLIAKLTLEKNYWYIINSNSTVPSYELQIIFNIKHLDNNTNDAFQEIVKRFSNSIENTNDNDTVVLNITDIQSDNADVLAKLIPLGVPEKLLAKIKMLCESSVSHVKSQTENIKYDLGQKSQSIQQSSLRTPPEMTSENSQNPSQNSNSQRTNKFNRSQ